MSPAANAVESAASIHAAAAEKMAALISTRKEGGDHDVDRDRADDRQRGAGFARLGPASISEGAWWCAAQGAGKTAHVPLVLLDAAVVSRPLSCVDTPCKPGCGCAAAD